MTDFFRKQYRFKIQSLSAREPCQTTLQRRVLPGHPARQSESLSQAARRPAQCGA